MSGPLLAFLAMLLLTAGCGKGVQRPVVQVLKHPNGLVLNLRDSISSDLTDSGFILYPNGKGMVRVPETIEISRHTGPVADALKDWEEREMEGGRVYYTIVESEGGSAGRQYEFTAWKPLPGGHLLLRQVTQSELGEPDFEEAWQVVEGMGISQ